MANKLNLSWSRGVSSIEGAVMDYLHTKVANGGRDRHCKFYYSAPGGSFLKVAVKRMAGNLVARGGDMLHGTVDSLFSKKITERQKVGAAWLDTAIATQKEELKEYGRMDFFDAGTGQTASVLALDQWGCRATEAFMLAIETQEDVIIRQKYPDYEYINSMATATYRHPLDEAADSRRYKTNTVKTKHIVWYDTTALVTISSDKNIVVSKIQGRDFSRKELVSNGDIKFSVSGQINSGIPDIYPAEEMKKFYRVMQYKGIVRVNNQVLGQLGIEHIVITDFNVSPKQGFKDTQQYSFNAIGLQPLKNIEIRQDTLDIKAPESVEAQKADTAFDSLRDNAHSMVNLAESISNSLIDRALQ